ncbi:MULTISPECIES: PKD domain-containing protein [unclassified Lentimicrobium]|uniref:T9SS type A sorting domain-containing protein n=1 Tax=unclassified Lentimicrobium TaxID=2677434 RepID=UPI001557187C|nr:MULTISPECIES: PKD domain-containing protein [unclassified Lentimicrobium]NPD46327.1 PKD domain-containing protein [Lentimicrobium sp. S6]NPD85759.1 PKD domain-containing protein [Lentimicrobium sp. L6]
MKRIYLFFVLVFLGTQIMALDLVVNGTVVDENGDAISGHMVNIYSSDSIAGFFYSNSVFTNSDGYYIDEITLDDENTQGEIILSTETCNDYLVVSQFFNPGNMEIYYDFEVCTDTSGGGGGNDTTNYSCENFFYYIGEGLEYQFAGEIFSEGDAIFSWNFGDGTTAEGMEVNHTFAEDGTYSVSLETVLNDTCEYISTQTIYVMQDTTGGGNDSTNCQNAFEFEVDDMTVTVWGYGLDNTEIIDFAWSFGDGTSAEGQEVTHEYANGGDYMIILTTTNVEGCVATSSHWVNIVGGSSGEFLWGQVFAENMPLDSGIASLYGIMNDTVSGQDFVLIAQCVIDSIGAYYFADIPQGSYLILAEADQSSLHFNTTYPTYYGDAIYWLDATIITLGELENPYDIILQTTSGANSGDGVINGDIIGDGFKSQLSADDISLFLLSETGNPLEITSSIDAGFDFSNIAFGTYMVYAEVIGLTTQPAIITLSADNPTSHVEINITENGVTTGLEDIASRYIARIGDIYPNPVGNIAYLEVEAQEATQVEVLIINQLGQVMYEAQEQLSMGTQRLEINTNQLKSGLYFLQLRNDGKNMISQKFIK